MGALDKLKKLKNSKVEKYKNHSMALEGLRMKPISHPQQGMKRALAEECGHLGQKVIRDVAGELAGPFNPIFSWFDTSSQQVFSITKVSSFSAHSSGFPNHTDTSMKPAPLTMLPLKSPACKRCPALSGGQCKCAIKALN